MKKLFLLLAFTCCMSFFANAQVTVFSETFDSVTVSMTSSGSPGYSLSSSYFSSPANSAVGGFDAGTESTYETPSFSTAGNNFIIFSFRHICKVTFFDSCLIDFSTDNGITWNTINGTNSIYLGTSAVYAALYNFSAGAYGIWDFGNPASIDNSWWQTESFDLSATLGNQPDVKLRFRMKDDNSGNGMQNFLGWFIDDVEVVMSPCELLNPAISYTGFAPSGITFGTGPYSINVDVTDGNSGVDTTSAVLHYNVLSNGVTTSYTVSMQVSNISLPQVSFTATIPQLLDGDTLCYYVSAADMCGNTDSTQVKCAYITTGVELSFFDFFDSGNSGWADTLVSGSGWELGTPAFGATTGAYSAPNAWDISLNSGYTSSSIAYLYSPVFDFTNATNALLSFYHNYDTENDWDGVRIDFSIDQGNTWMFLGVPNDPNGYNWYTDISLNSSTLPGWEGGSNGWQNARYQLNFFSGYSDVRYRFVFTSDGQINGDGYSLDNFSITLPVQFDLEAVSVATVAPMPSGSIVNSTVNIANTGGDTIPSFQIVITLNGISIDTIDVASPLAPGAIAPYPFSFTTPDGAYTICATILSVLDMNSGNNTTCTSGLGIPNFSLPYSSDFENDGSDWQTSFTNPLTIWEYGTPGYGVTTGAYSGANCWDINLNNPYGAMNSNAYLYTPYFTLDSLNGNIRVSFVANYRILSGFQGLTLEYELNQSGVWVRAGVVNDPSGFNWYNNVFGTYNQFSDNSNGWKKSFLNMAFPPSGLIRFRFVFRTQGAALDGVSIDNFGIMQTPEDDIAVIDIDNISGPVGGSLSPVVTIKNYGLNPETGFNVAYAVNGTNQSSSVYTGTLVAGQSDTISLSGFVLPNGSFSICANTELAFDAETSNDTLCKEGKGVVVLPLPYFDNFEGQDLWTVVTNGNSQTNWERGYPAYGYTTGTHSGNNCWDINLNAGYSGDANTMLVSPYFDFSTVAFDTLSFWHNYLNENTWDGTRIDYSLDASDTWQVLGYLGDPNATNWYTLASINSSQLPAWTDTSDGGWVKSTYNLAGLGNPSVVQFRFVFTSDGSVNRDGHSIDDFAISNALNEDIVVQSVSSPAANVAVNSTVSVDVSILNAGLLSASGFNIYYSLNGGTPVMTSFTGTLASLTASNVNLGNILISQSGSNQLKIYTDWANDLNRSNDTLLYVFNATATMSIPYYTDFETNNDWTSANSTGGSQWQWGMPAYGVTNNIHSGVACWDINLTSPYGSMAYATLTSPIFDFSNVTQTQLNFWTNYKIETGSDGCQLQYSTDDVNWSVLGIYNDPNGSFWYDNAAVTAFNGQPAWSGNSQGWQYVTYNTSLVEGQAFVRFRFLFRSDPSISDDGISIDDFAINGTVGINESGNKDAVQLYPNPAGNTLYIKAGQEIQKVELYDAEGRLIQDIDSNSGTLKTKVDISSIAEGLYFVKVFTRDSVYSEKVVKK